MKPTHRGTYDVAIVGAGPTGTVLAILLAQNGHSVALVDKRSEPYPLPRAVAFDHEVGRILQACGIGPELRELIQPADTYEWRNADGTTLLKFDNRGDGSCGWPRTSMFHQPALEFLLAERVDHVASIDVFRGWEVVGLHHDGASVTLSGRASTGPVASTSGIPDSTLEARFAVACDGANSTVRALLDIGFDDLGFFYDWLVVDVVLDDARVYDPVNLQVCDPRRPTTVVSGGPGRRRWEFMRLPGEDVADLTGEPAAWALLEPWDVRPDNARLERHANYTFRARWAKQWRVGSILLAGDAAHQMPPFAGQGMCSGVRDAANLAWKLNLVLRNLASESLLETYQTERLPNVEAVINLSIELGKVICIPDPAEAAARDESMIAALTPDGRAPTPELPGIITGIVDGSTPHFGELFIQGVVAAGDGTESASPLHLDDLVGLGFRFVGLTTVFDEISVDLARWFLDIGGSFVIIDDDGPIRDVNHHYAQWFSRHETIAVLQRPDSYIFGTAATSSEVDALLARLNTSLDIRGGLSP
jgi:2-polyprenyl-6-methoxyphenol hydroxylase-like FAD-dependent oxidoreductase